MTDRTLTSNSCAECSRLQRWLADSRHKNANLRDATNAVLAHFMPSFPDSRAVDDCLVGLAAAVADIESHSHETGEGVCKEALGRIAAGTYTESGAEQHAKDILKALGMLEAPAQKAIANYLEMAKDQAKHFALGKSLKPRKRRSKQHCEQRETK